jgi:hypothetical protein
MRIDAKPCAQCRHGTLLDRCTAQHPDVDGESTVVRVIPAPRSHVREFFCGGARFERAPWAKEEAK